MTIKFGKFKGEEVGFFIKALYSAVCHAGSIGNQDPVELFHKVGASGTGEKFGEITAGAIGIPCHVTHFADHGIEVVGIGEFFCNFCFQFLSSMVVIFGSIDVAYFFRIAAEAFFQPCGGGTEEFYAGEGGGDFLGFSSGGNKFFLSFRISGGIDFQIFVFFLKDMVFCCDIYCDFSSVIVYTIADEIIHFRDNDTVKSAFACTGNKDTGLNGAKPDPKKCFHFFSFFSCFSG